jgi:chitodextrinase
VAAPSDTTPPTAPATLSGSAAGLQVSLSWKASTDNVGVVQYKIYRNNTEVANTTSLTYTDASLTTAGTYTYQVRAMDAAGNLSQPSNAWTTTVAVPVGTLSISQIKATWNAGSSNSSATIQWTTNVPSTGVVYYGLSSSSLSSRAADPSFTTSHSVTLTGLKTGTVYYFAIRGQAQNTTLTSTSSIASFQTQ